LQDSRGGGGGGGGCRILGGAEGGGAHPGPESGPVVLPPGLCPRPPAPTGVEEMHVRSERPTTLRADYRPRGGRGRLPHWSGMHSVPERKPPLFRPGARACK